MGLTPTPSSGTTANTRATVSKAGSAISRSASGVTKAIRSSSGDNRDQNTIEETVKDEGNNVAEKRTTTPKSEVLLKRLLKNDQTLDAKKITQEMDADAKQWQQWAREAPQNAAKIQAAQANAALIGKAIESAFKAAGGMLAKLSKKLGGGGGGGEDQASAAGGGNRQDQASAAGGDQQVAASSNTGTEQVAASSDAPGTRTATANSATEGIARASQADAEWGMAGAQKGDAIENSRMAIAGERETNSGSLAMNLTPEANAITENFSQEMEIAQENQEQQLPEVQMIENQISEENYA